MIDRVSAQLLSFPNPVNEKAARTVAAGVFVISIVTLATGAYRLRPQPRRPGGAGGAGSRRTRSVRRA
jgi:hypothetical protein